MTKKEECGYGCNCEQDVNCTADDKEKDEACGCSEHECGDGKCGCGDDCSCGNDAEAEATEPTAEEVESERYMRLMAEFQNYKRRSEKEKTDIYAYANEKVISELLNVADNFERALASSAEANEGFIKGMEMIFKQLQDVMTKAGAAEIEALGADFDPNFHNAVMMEDSEEYESGKVSAVLQKGYTLNGKVIRPSMVKVAN